VTGTSGEIRAASWIILAIQLADVDETNTNPFVIPIDRSLELIPLRK